MRYISSNAGHNLRVKLIRKLLAGLWEVQSLERTKQFNCGQILHVHQSDLKDEE
jgi:hypothetical protein